MNRSRPATLFSVPLSLFPFFSACYTMTGAILEPHEVRNRLGIRCCKRTKTGAHFRVCVP